MFCSLSAAVARVVKLSVVLSSFCSLSFLSVCWGAGGSGGGGCGAGGCGVARSGLLSISVIVGWFVCPPFPTDFIRTFLTNSFLHGPKVPCRCRLHTEVKSPTELTEVKSPTELTEVYGQ